MNREIKFRGKDIHGVWRYGYLFQGETENNEKYSVILKQSRYNSDDRLDEDLPFAFYKDEVYVINIDTVGQFTGLTDMNGKEIYDGDIVKWKRNGRLYLVKFWSGMFYASIEEMEDNICGGFPLHALTDSDDTKYICEVIGNVHDNPELLKQ